MFVVSVGVPAVVCLVFEICVLALVVSVVLCVV